MAHGKAFRRQCGNAVEEVDVEFELGRTSTGVGVREAKVGHRVARTFWLDLVPSLLGQSLEFGEEFGSALLRLLGVGGAEVIQVDVDREAWHVQVEKVERGAAAQRDLVTESPVDSPEELDEAEDGLERSSTEAGLARDASEVALVGDAVHVVSGRAGRR